MNYPLPEGIYRVKSGKKIYFIPYGIDKGSAVTRFGSRQGYDSIICAGDSEMDIPMLQIGQVSFVPNNFRIDAVMPLNTHVCSGDAFALEALSWIERIAEDGFSKIDKHLNM